MCLSAVFAIGHEAQPVVFAQQQGLVLAHLANVMPGFAVVASVLPFALAAFEVGDGDAGVAAVVVDFGIREKAGDFLSLVVDLVLGDAGHVVRGFGRHGHEGAQMFDLYIAFFPAQGVVSGAVDFFQLLAQIGLRFQRLDAALDVCPGNLAVFSAVFIVGVIFECAVECFGVAQQSVRCGDDSGICLGGCVDAVIVPRVAHGMLRGVRCVRFEIRQPALRENVLVRLAVVARGLVSLVACRIIGAAGVCAQARLCVDPIGCFPLRCFGVDGFRGFEAELV